MTKAGIIAAHIQWLRHAHYRLLAEGESVRDLSQSAAVPARTLLTEFPPDCKSRDTRTSSFFAIVTSFVCWQLAPTQRALQANHRLKIVCRITKKFVMPQILLSLTSPSPLPADFVVCR
jgi:hypothetical protein